MRTKLQGVRSKGCIIKGDVFSLTSFFAVPKGDSDIRMVYDGTKSGLNGMLWAPWLPLPTIDAHLRAMLPGYFMSDIDIGEMFLNFMLHESVQKYCGVDLTQLFPEEVLPGQVLWERWGRCGMGFVFPLTNLSRVYSGQKRLSWVIVLMLPTHFALPSSS